MKAYIYTGGRVLTDRPAAHPAESDLCIAADSGYRTARRLGAKIDLLIGDMDSLDGAADAIAEVEAAGGEIVRVKAEKDETDTQLAVAEALLRGADEIVIIGGLSGRLDHTLSNLAILEDLAARGVRAVITDGQNRVRFLQNDSLLLANEGFRYLSLIAIDEVCRGVSLEGCRYPLQNARLSRRNQYAVSNEMTGRVAFISVRRGRLYIVESSDI